MVDCREKGSLEEKNNLIELEYEHDIKTERKTERIRKQKNRQQMTNFETIKERISLKMKMRNLREGRTGKEHLKENLKSKKECAF